MYTKKKKKKRRKKYITYKHHIASAAPPPPPTHTHAQKECSGDGGGGGAKERRQNLKSFIFGIVCRVDILTHSEGTGGPNVTDARRKRIPLRSTVRERERWYLGAERRVEGGDGGGGKKINAKRKMSIAWF